MRKIIWAMTALLAGCGVGHSTADSSSPPVANATGDYVKTNGGAPVLLFAGSIDSTITGNGVTPVGPELIQAGYSVIALDLPCHGADDSGVDGLTCWRNRIQGGDGELINRFCARVSAVIDTLHLTSIPAAGISRGGFVAITCAAHDSRISMLGLIAPVTDLRKLEEFASYTPDATLAGMDLEQYIPRVFQLPTLLRMNLIDPRVDTESARMYLANFPHVTYEMIDTTGHGIPEATETVQWLKLMGYPP